MVQPLSEFSSVRSLPGIILAAVLLIVMPMLSHAKKDGKKLEAKLMSADAKRTDFRVYLSVILLVGPILNAVFGGW